MNLKAMLDNTVGLYADKTAIAHGDVNMSYAELEESSSRITNKLLALGIKKGDRVAMLLLNSPRFVSVFFGIVKSGAIAVPLDTKYKTDELNCILEHCRPVALFVEKPYIEPLVPLLPQWDYIKHFIDVSANASRQYLSYGEIVDTSPSQKVELDIAAQDTALIIYTSGPAFNPKGAMLSHGSLVSAVSISANGFKQTEKDVMMLFALPMHHIVGLVIILLASIYRGSTVAMLSGLSINNLMGVIEKERATIFISVPFIHRLVVKKAMEEGIEHDLSSLRFCGSIGAPLSVELTQQFERHLGFKLINFYGLTESTTHVSCQSLNGSGKPGSVGRALPGWEIMIVDDQNRELPANHSGEVIIKGPIMSRYYENEGDTQAMIKKGWLYTSDIGRIDEDGCLFLEGLKKDMIITKGQNIYPSDIEGVLANHPKVAAVAAVGIPDGMRGEVVGVAMALEDGAAITVQQIRKYCLKHLANYKVPKQVVFLDVLPQASDGTPDRRVITKLLLEAYSDEKAEEKAASQE
jgi:long-chain acyl-CoA synthetase